MERYISSNQNLLWFALSVQKGHIQSDNPIHNWVVLKRDLKYLILVKYVLLKLSNA
jgi:hypothetical protein